MRRRRRNIGISNSILVCKTAGIAYIPSTQAYGEWIFDLYKGADANTTRIYFIQNTNDFSDDGYAMYLTPTEEIGLYLWGNGGAVGVLMRSAASYIAINTWYSIKIIRIAGGIFTIYIKGGSFGNSWQLIDVTGGAGTNPVTNNTYTVSTHFDIDLDAGDKIRRIDLSETGHLNVRNFNILSGEFSIE